MKQTFQQGEWLLCVYFHGCVCCNHPVLFEDCPIALPFFFMEVALCFIIFFFVVFGLPCARVAESPYISPKQRKDSVFIVESESSFL